MSWDELELISRSDAETQRFLGSLGDRPKKNRANQIAAVSIGTRISVADGESASLGKRLAGIGEKARRI